MGSRTAFASILVVVICVSEAIGAEGAPRQPTFPPPPRLATTAEELEAAKAAPDFASKRDAAVAAAEALVATPPVLPDGFGSWIFYYACPDDGTALTALSATEHQCPNCKKTYGDERTVASYRCKLHYDAETAAEKLAWAYAYSGDESFAKGVRRVLLKFADDYQTYPDRLDRWGRTGMFARLGGRRYVQSLDEAVGACRLTRAYDLTRTSKVWTDGQRRHVEEDFFRATADSLLRFNQDINNHQTWYNAGLMCIASVLGDAALVEKVLTMKGGFDDQLARSVGRDGLWYEGAMAYHNYALQAMLEIADAGRRMGIPLHEAPKFRLMIEGPARAAYPDGSFPAINDSDPNSIAMFQSAYDWAAKAYNDPDFAKKASAVSTRSEVLEDSGLAILRQGSGKDATCAMIDFGPHGGGHGHFDKLNLVLFANGHEWLLDPGRLDYSHKEYKTWVKTTAAHNTVTLDGRSQRPTTGKLLWMKEGDGWSACAAESDGAYDGALLRRYVLVGAGFAVDAFQVHAPETTQIDLLTHVSVGNPGPPATQPASGVPAGDGDGYQHFSPCEKLAALPAEGWTCATPEGAALHVRPVSADGDVLLLTDGIGYWISQRVPTLIRRRQAKETVFLAVYDAAGGGELLKDIKPTADDPLGFQFRRNGQAWEVRFGPKGPTVVASH